MTDDIAYGGAGLGKSYARRPPVVGPGNRLEYVSSAPLSYSQTLAELVAAMFERFPEQQRACKRTRGHSTRTSAAALDVTSRPTQPKEQH